MPRTARLSKPAFRSLSSSGRRPLGKLAAEGVQWLVRLRRLWFMLLAALLLSGCVRYDVGINFADQHHGTIVQHIHLSERLTRLNQDLAQAWLTDLEGRSHQIGGHSRHPSSGELVVTIPFHNGADLQQKFNQFFHPTPPDEPDSGADSGADFGAATIGHLPNLESRLQLQESNFLLVLREHLSYDLDLKPLGLLSDDGSVVVSPGSLLDLEFSITTPWGAHSVAVDGALAPSVNQQGKQLIWTLHSGETSHLEAIFWLPSPLGMGTAVIVLLVITGATAKNYLVPR